MKNILDKFVCAIKPDISRAEKLIAQNKIDDPQKMAAGFRFFSVAFAIALISIPALFILSWSSTTPPPSDITPVSPICVIPVLAFFMYGAIYLRAVANIIERGIQK